MTLEEIRENPEARAELASILRHPLVIQLLVALEDTIDGADVDDGADPIASTRKLSRAAGERAMLKRLRDSILPFAAIEPDEVGTYGSGLSPEQAEAALNSL